MNFIIRIHDRCVCVRACALKYIWTEFQTVMAEVLIVQSVKCAVLPYGRPRSFVSSCRRFLHT